VSSDRKENNGEKENTEEKSAKAEPHGKLDNLMSILDQIEKEKDGGANQLGLNNPD
jgi:hypothetical protein